MAAGKSLTALLQDLQTLLPAALECCSGSQQSQGAEPVVAKLRNVLLALLDSCVCSAPGKGPATVGSIIKALKQHHH